MAIIRLRKASLAIVFVCIYILLGFITEMLSFCSILHQGENFLIANYYDLFCLLLLLGYCIFQVKFKQPKWRYAIAFAIIILSLTLNMLWYDRLSHGHFNNLEFSISLTIIICSFMQIRFFAANTTKDTQLSDPQLLLPMLFVSYHQINLWCKSASYANNNLNLVQLEFIYHILLINNIIFYTCLGWILLLPFRKAKST